MFETYSETITDSDITSVDIDTELDINSKSSKISKNTKISKITNTNYSENELPQIYENYYLRLNKWIKKNNQDKFKECINC